MKTHIHKFEIRMHACVTIKFFQINLHHSKSAMAALCQQLAEGRADIALIQEPWLYKGQIRGLTNTGETVYSVAPENNARSCIYIGVILMPYLCSSSVQGCNNGEDNIFIWRWLRGVDRCFSLPSMTQLNHHQLRK
jgi:hypothetical protein